MISRLAEIFQLSSHRYYPCHQMPELLFCCSTTKKCKWQFQLQERAVCQSQAVSALFNTSVYELRKSQQKPGHQRTPCSNVWTYNRMGRELEQFLAFWIVSVTLACYFTLHPFYTALQLLLRPGMLQLGLKHVCLFNYLFHYLQSNIFKSIKILAMRHRSI